MGIAMQTREADVVVVGAGSVGSMAAWQLSRRGLKVVALDRFSIPGPLSAYAGESRLFRKVYAEGGHYTPLLQRSQDLWLELGAASGTTLLELPGAVTIAGQGDPDLDALLRATESYQLSYEILDSSQARARFPGHTILDTDTVFFDPEGGFVRSEKAVNAAIRLAVDSGVTLLPDRKVLAVEPDRDGYRVRTQQEVVLAPKVIVSAGTGAGAVVEALGTHLAVLPQVLTWFPVRPGSTFGAPGSPTFIRRSADAQFYGFPSSDGWTVKVAASIYLDEVASMELPPVWDPAHLATIRGWVDTYLPELVPDPVRAAVCADGYTVDEDGLLGEVPGMPGVIAAVGFSGHGFKMATAFGAVAAELALTGSSPTDIAHLDPARFLAPGTTVSHLALA